MFVHLADGTELFLRPIRPEDKRGLAIGFGRLSEASRYRRFLSPKPRLSSAELRYLTEVDGQDHVAFVVEDPDEADALIAVGRWVRLADEPTTAEIAITVADCWQGRGIGSMLARALADEAPGHGILRFSATISSENLPALRLMRHASDHLEQRHAGAGVDELAVDLAA